MIINIILLNTLVDEDLANTNRVVDIFDFYQDMKNDSHDKILFLGSSQTAGDIDSLAIEARLLQKNISAQVYNLGYSADTPLRRSTELASILEIRPKIVFIGLTYYGLNDTSFPISSDSLALVSGWIKLDDFSRSLFTDEEISLIEMNQLEREIYKRKFILPAIKNRILGGVVEENLNPRDFKVPQSFAQNLTPELLRIRLNNSRDMIDKYTVPSEDNSQKRALEHTISDLTSNGVRVFVINMPLNPMFSEMITNESRRNYQLFINNTIFKVNYKTLNSTTITSSVSNSSSPQDDAKSSQNGVTYHLDYATASYHDFESRYPLNLYSDLTHLNQEGKRIFSIEMARLIELDAKEMENHEVMEGENEETKKDEAKNEVKADGV